jgi:epoxyqueuosine reductase
MTTATPLKAPDPTDLAGQIKAWARELGFDDVGITAPNLATDEAHLLRWLRRGYQGGMGYMGRHGVKRARPARLHPGTRRVICVRMDYSTAQATPTNAVLGDRLRAFIARYALGRDYHKLMRKRLQQLAQRVEARIGPFGYRAFVDSAPVLEKALARDAGLGWIGKNTLLLDRDGGSYFLLGELFTDLPLPIDEPGGEHCGTCRACMTACPTGAIVGPYQLDARKCISYLTIEHHGPIPEALRPYLGNRIFGCDDCQTVCPWNKFSSPTEEPRFEPKEGINETSVRDWVELELEEYEKRFADSPVSRPGFENFKRNARIAAANVLETGKE